MSISLSHLGEVIVAEMAQRKRLEIIRALGLTDKVDPEHVVSVERFAFDECRLAPHNGFSFDGASRVDVVLWIQPDLAVALELKLGEKRLTKTRIDGEFLASCRSSHDNTRIAGNMMAILDRRFGDLALPDGLSVMIDGHPVPLARCWFIIARQEVLNRWSGDNCPSFSQHTRCVGFKTLVEAHGGRQAFNELVTELLAIDYYDDWVS